MPSAFMISLFSFNSRYFAFIPFRDPKFNLNDFLRSLRVELKSWRKVKKTREIQEYCVYNFTFFQVFWRLWGICHTLYCSLCSTHFPAYLHEFCSFHPQDPEFPTIQFKNSTQPFGNFTCCQMPINRFQPLPANQKVTNRQSSVCLLNIHFRF